MSSVPRVRAGVPAPGLVQLSQLSLAEEENADQLLNQLARPLMSAARMPEPVA
jgi:Mn-containing catalase